MEQKMNIVNLDNINQVNEIEPPKPEETYRLGDIIFIPSIEYYYIISSCGELNSVILANILTGGRAGESIKVTNLLKITKLEVVSMGGTFVKLNDDSALQLKSTLRNLLDKARWDEPSKSK
jgi:hypothetical protein